MLAKIDINSAQMEPSSAEELADTLFEIGRSQSRRAQWSEVIFWFEKAYDAISSQELQELSSDAEELMIAIMHGLARAFVNQENEESRAKAWDLIRKLDIECGDRLVVLLLKLDALALDPMYDPHDYSEVLRKIVHTAHLNDTNIRTILHHVHKLKARSGMSAHAILSTLLLQRLLGAEKPKWLEKIFVTLIWNCTTSSDFPNPLSSLNEVFDTLAADPGNTLSPSATHAAQIVRPPSIS